MPSQPNQWDKSELQLYIFLLCANADNQETEAELNIIKSKFNGDTFKSIYAEFNRDNEEKRLEKIESAISAHHFTTMELSAFRTEIHEIFMSDGRLSLHEGRLDSLLDNILY
jgi:hypothetical protein